MNLSLPSKGEVIGFARPSLSRTGRGRIDSASPAKTARLVETVVAAPVIAMVSPRA